MPPKGVDGNGVSSPDRCFDTANFIRDKGQLTFGTYVWKHTLDSWTGSAIPVFDCACPHKIESERNRGWKRAASCRLRPESQRWPHCQLREPEQIWRTHICEPSSHQTSHVLLILELSHNLISKQRSLIIKEKMPPNGNKSSWVLNQADYFNLSKSAVPIFLRSHAFMELYLTSPLEIYFLALTLA